jgi:hypothetical protein
MLAEAAHVARYGSSSTIKHELLQLLIDTRVGLLGGLADG